MMPRKLFQRLTDEQEAMAKAAVEGNREAYEKAEAEQIKLYEILCHDASTEQLQEWSLVFQRLDAWVSSHLTRRAADLPYVAGLEADYIEIDGKPIMVTVQPSASR